MAVVRKKCMVEGCSAPVHAKGYCRRHYGQIWRKGEISPAKIEREQITRSSRADMERLRALEREVKKAEHMYRVVVGYEGRVKWRREMDAVRAEILKLEKLHGVRN
jgi:hypothetical protein